MKASVCRLAAVLLFFAAVLIPLSGRAAASGEPEDPADLWKAAYEALNGETNKDGKAYPEVLFPHDFPVLLPENEEILELFSSGTGILYFGFPECPWCRTLLPVLSEVMAGYPGVPLYAWDLREDRDEYVLEETGEIRLVREGTDLYRNLLSVLDGYLGAYRGLGDDTIKRIYMPTLVFLEDGEIKTVHIGTVDGQESGYDPLTETQRAELASILEEAIRTVASDNVHYCGFSGEAFSVSGEPAAKK